MTFTTRPLVMARRGMVTSGHYLATAAGFRILEQGGNAIDAAAAMCFCVQILEPHNAGPGGDVPTLIYSAKEKKTYALSGMGFCAQAFSIDWCRAHGIDLIPGDGFLPACVPAPVGSWTLALARFGTMTFAQVAAPVIELAEHGYPMYAHLRDFLISNQARFTARYPSTAAIYYPQGKAPEVGQFLRNPEFAATFRTLCEAEAKASLKGRAAGLQAVADAFYRGPIAERFLSFMSKPIPDISGKSHAGLLTADDFASWQATLEEPVSYQYQGLDVHKCPGWTQGPVFVQQLALLAGFDLKALGHNSAPYVHTLIECAKLAFADREAYYGDPAFDPAPFDVLLSEKYNAARRKLVGREASLEMRPGEATPGRRPAYAASFDVLADNQRALTLAGHPGGARDMTTADPHHKGDTTHLDAVDHEGNMVACTPSGGWIQSSPCVPGVGFPIGTRGQMFYLNAQRPNALEPRKRPRATLTPTLVTQRGEPWMVFGTPGGDTQDQITLQFFLNHVVFGMNLAEAADAPVFYSQHFPSSFYPRTAFPGRMVAEDRIDPGVLAELEKRGHDVKRAGGWSTGKVMGIRCHRERGLLSAGVSPRGEVGYALGW